MENRYLFRGKRIDNGEWVEGYLSYPFCTKKGNESYQNCFDSTKTENVGFYVDWSVTDKKYMRKDLGYWINMVDAEVIGNTFDNPELLEV